MKARTLLFVLLVVVFAAFSFSAAAQDVAREDTVVFDIDGPAGAVANFDQMNWMLPNSHRQQGLASSRYRAAFHPQLRNRRKYALVGGEHGKQRFA